MTAYAAFLRGINLGGKTQLAMADLRRVASELGYDDVATYINSGNLVFTSPKRRSIVERELAAGIAEELGRSVDLAVRSRAELASILAQNPYPDGDPSQVTVAFLIVVPPPGAPDRVAAVAAEHEPYLLSGTEVYVHYSRGIGRSKLAQEFSKIVGVSATVRNLRTVGKVVDLLGR